MNEKLTLNLLIGNGVTTVFTTLSALYLFFFDPDYATVWLFFGAFTFVLLLVSYVFIRDHGSRTLLRILISLQFVAIILVVPMTHQI